MTKKLASECSRCSHWSKDNLGWAENPCTKEHKPRFYGSDAKWKRVCQDFREPIDISLADKLMSIFGFWRKGK